MILKEIKKLTVKYNSKIVGFLALTKNNEIAFEYDVEWLQKGFSISPLSLPLKKQIFINKKDNFDGLFGVFHDCLPSGWGFRVLTKQLSKEGININQLSPLTLLSLTNKTNIGALSFEPQQTFPHKLKNKVSLDGIFKLLNSEEVGINLDQFFNVMNSSGGARPKIHIDVEGVPYIIKFPMQYESIDVGKKEFQMNDIAKKSGLNVNDFKLFESKICNGFFGAKRFDFSTSNKIHTISLASLLETTIQYPNLDYNHLFKIVDLIAPADKIEAFKRMSFNVLTQNKDDHGKNFSFIYNEEIKSYQLSPAYDLTHTPQKLEHEMTVLNNGKPTKQDLLQIAKIQNIPNEKALEIISIIEKEISRNPLSNKELKSRKL